MAMQKMKKEINCRGYGVKEGEFHHFGCREEVCPYCGGKLMKCDCLIDSSLNRIPDGMKPIYLHYLNQVGRIPFGSD